MKSTRALLAALVLACTAPALQAQTEPLASRDVQVWIDSGSVRNDLGVERTIYSKLVQVQDASWLRLAYRRADLAPGAYLRITSVLDGAEQTQHAEHVAQWSNTSAYFNGDAVLVEIVAPPHSGESRLLMTTVTAGEVSATDSICGPTDDRVLSSDPRAARLVPIGCTIWIFNDANRCFLTAGHCISNGTTNAVAEFNVPLSTSGGSIVHPPPSDQYAIDPVSIQSNGGLGTGNDYAYCGAFDNSVTGKSPFEAQGQSYTLAPAPAVAGQQVRITGYGVTSAPISPTWSQVQKTHVGPYFSISGTWLQYQTDTTGGNSGSPVINENTGEAMGIHTHGGCSTTSGNSGTASQHAGLQAFLANPKGVCIPQGLKFEFPSGLPTEIAAAGGTSFPVKVLANAGNTPQPNTGKLFYSTGGSFVSMPMTQTAPNEYLATFPAIACPANVKYYVAANATSGTMYTEPPTAPGNSFPAIVGVLQVNTIFSTSLSTLPAGWTQSGLWHITSNCSIGTSCDGGAYAYYGIDGTCTFNNGSTNAGTLSSNSIALPAVPAAGSLSLEFCYNLATENLSPYDHAAVLVNGTEVAAMSEASAWTAATVDLKPYQGTNVTIGFRFDTVDNIANDFRGFQVDGISIKASQLTCPCYADCEGDGDLDVFDFLCFQGKYATQAPYADCENDGDWDVFDFLCFQGKYAAGC